MKKVIYSFLLIVSVTFASQGESPNQFRYAFGNGENQKIPVAGDDQIDGRFMDEGYQFYFMPIKNAYLYLILFDQEEGVRLLFPASFSQFSDVEYEGFPKYLIPENGKWPSTKIKEINYLVSNKRLPALENLLTQYAQTSAREESLLLKKKIESEIKRIKRACYFRSDEIRIEPGQTGVERNGQAEFINNSAETVIFNDFFIKIFKVAERDETP